MLSLDKLDAEIITLLQSDGRRPTVEIARRLAVAEGTVRKRIERLSREKVIQISAWADPLKIGYQNYAVHVRCPGPAPGNLLAAILAGLGGRAL